MFLRVLQLAALLVSLAPTVLAEDALAEKGKPRTDLQNLQGTWQMESFEDAKKTKVDPKTRTLFFGAETAAFREGNRFLMAGTVSLTTSKTPRRMDIAMKKGERDSVTTLGIYELKGDTLKICLDPEGDSRPTAFEAKAGTSHYVAVYKRLNKAVEAIDIIGKYTSTADAVSVTAEIQKLGDCYQVTWTVPDGVAYAGVGIRTGDVLSVTWGNRGSVGLSVYQITNGPKLSGQYTMLGGPGIVSREVLKPFKEKRVDVRNRE